MKQEMRSKCTIYAVIDTNVIVSALLSLPKETNPSIVLLELLHGRIVPLYNDEILTEYRKVLSRDKFPFKKNDIDSLLNYFYLFGIDSERIMTDRSVFPDPKDIVFYEISLSKEDSYLVTGNIKHFPKSPKVITPAEMVVILKSYANLPH